MSLLLHICCAPCSVACVKMLREEGTEPTGFWYNPNIHPFLEYKARRDTLRQYAQDIGLDLREEDFYGLRQFTAAVAQDNMPPETALRAFPPRSWCPPTKTGS